MSEIYTPELLDHFAKRKTYADRKLSEHSGPLETCFALSNFEYTGDTYNFGKLGQLRKAHQPPEELELAHALETGFLMSAIARHMPSVTYELAIYREDEKIGELELNIGWLIVSAIRCRSTADILIPAAASVSWDVLSAVPRWSCQACLIEDIPNARLFGPSIEVTVDVLDWVNNSLDTWEAVIETPAFRLAVDSLTTHSHHANLRMTAAALWAGFEALFGITAELSFRLSLLAASYLEERGPERLATYRRIKKLYSDRSKAVHGSAISDQKLEDHVLEVRSLLSRLICAIIDEGKMPTPEDFENRLLM